MADDYDYTLDEQNVIDEGYDSDIIAVDNEHPKLKTLEELGLKKPRAAGGAGGSDDFFGTEEGTEGQQFMAVKPWLGAIKEPSKPPKNNPSAPSQQLEIEWAHGYRGFDSRNNVYINGRGHIVYPVAGMVVVYDPIEKTQKHYMGHDDDVICLAQHPTNLNIFVSGQNATISHVDNKGKPPFVCVWDSTDFSKTWVLKMTQEDRAIRSVGFSTDGQHVATVSNDDNHTVKVFDWQKKKMLAAAKGDQNEILLLRWNHKQTNEFVTVGQKHVTFWSFTAGKLKGTKAMMGGKYPWQNFYSLAFSEKGYACAGAFDGSIYVFIGGSVAKVFKGVHTGKVISLDWWPGGLVSGGADGYVKVLDRTLSPVKSIQFEKKITSVYMLESELAVGTSGSEVFYLPDWQNADDDARSASQPNTTDNQSMVQCITQGHHDGELWGLALSPDGQSFITCGEENLVAIWSIEEKKMMRRAILNEKKGKAPAVRKASTTSAHPPNQCARGAAWSPDGNHVAVGLNDGSMIVYDANTLDVVVRRDLNQYGKRQVVNQTGNWIQVLQYSPTGRTLAVGTHGSVICLLSVDDDYAVKGTIKSHNSFLTHIDFNEDGTQIQSVCGAYELLFHTIDEDNLKNSTQIGNATSMRDTKWSTQTCKFGWPVQGIFDPSQKGSDINTVDVNSSRSLVVTGDDWGNVNLFRYPVLEGNKFNVYEGHSSHVPTVRFTQDESRVISTGGHDKAVIQWRVV